MTLITTDINLASEMLKNEDVIGMPTETVYGLAGNIYSEKAIKKIYEIKKRPFINPLIVHIKSLECLNKVAINVSESALKLANTFWPGPLTLILDKHSSIPDLITAGKNTVAVRIPNHPVALALLEIVNFPLAAPSANPFGCISPTSAKHVAEYFNDEISIVLEGGNCQKGIESTIIGFRNKQPILYRHGSISVQEIEAVVGKLEILTKNDSAPEAPGMLSKHYAPITETFLTNDVIKFIKKSPHKKIGLLLFKQEIDNQKIIHQEVLSKSGDLKEAASNLYAALHRLDKLNLDIIIAEQFPDIGLGKTINDRLERATKR